MTLPGPRLVCGRGWQGGDSRSGTPDTEKSAADTEKSAADSEESAADTEKSAADSEESAADTEKSAADSEESGADTEVWRVVREAPTQPPLLSPILTQPPLTRVLLDALPPVDPAADPADAALVRLASGFRSRFRSCLSRFASGSAADFS